MRKSEIQDRPTDREAQIKHVGADIIYREGLRRREYPKAYERAALLVDSSPELRAVAVAYIRYEADTRELGEAIERAES
jgi:hypothetical protein